MSPVHPVWKRANLRRFAAMKTGHTPSRSVTEYWNETNIPWFTLADVWQLRDGRQTYLGETASRISELGLLNSAAELLPAGTVVLSRTASVGFSGVMPAPMATSQDFWNWVCGPELVPEFLNYQFKAKATELRGMNLGSTHQTIYQKDAASIQILVPPVVVQQKIVTYLDRETARIDTLIQEQQRLIELLRERRAATVVARLRSATAETSGQRLKHVVTETRQGWSPECYPWPTDGTTTWGVLKAGAANGGHFRPQENKELPASETPRPDLAVRRGEVIVSRANTRDLVGSAAVVDEDFPRLMLCDKLYALSIDRTRADPSYVAAYLGLPETRDAIELMASGSSPSMQNIRKSDILNLRVDLPSVTDQHRAVKAMRHETTKINALIAEAERFIELSQERRSSLIAATVTGQIDVSEAA